MKKIKIFFYDFILSKIAKKHPHLYLILIDNLYNLYSKIANFIKYGDPHFIRSINIEICTYCNRKCDYCPNKHYETPKKFMDEKVFYRIIFELKRIKFSGLFQYAFYNEPLYDKRIVQFVEYVKNELPECTQILISNGDMLNVDNTEILSNAGIDQFIITIHDKDPQRGLERLKPVKDKLQKKIILQSCLDLEIENRGGSIDIKKYDKISKTKHCNRILGPIILYNGDVDLCCQDYFRRHTFGNIMEKSITDIWYSEKYKKVRKDLLIDKKPVFNICKSCLGIDIEK